MAIKNKLLALVFGALNGLGFKVWFQKGCVHLDQCFLSVFGIGAKFPQRKFDNITPYFHGRNLAILCLRCIIALKTLFSLSFSCKNTAMEVPYFHSENLVEFRVCLAKFHACVYGACQHAYARMSRSPSKHQAY